MFMAFVGLHVLSKDGFFHVTLFFPDNDSHGTFHYNIGLVGMHSAADFYG